MRGTFELDTDLFKDYNDSFSVEDSIYDLGSIFQKVLSVKPDIVILDYIGLAEMKWSKGAEENARAYAKQVMAFVKKTGVAWIDLSNLTTATQEEEIRKSGAFMDSSLLRNNCDVWLFFFYHKNFYVWKKEMIESNMKELLIPYRNSQVVTCLVHKNRLGDKFIEQEYCINWDRGAEIREVSHEEKSTWF
jgi:hypothetical protein